MKLLFFYLLTIHFTIVCSAQGNNITIEKKAKQLVLILQKDHFQPFSNDSIFNFRVNDLLLKALDEDKVLFTKTQIIEIQQKSKNLRQEINSENLSYLKFVQALYVKQLNEIQTIVNNQEKTLSQYQSTFKTQVVNTDYFAQIDLNNYWKNHCMSLILQEMADLSKDKAINDRFQLAKTKVFKEEKALFKQWLADTSQLSHLFLNAIAEAYDPHTSYFSSDENKEFKEELSAERKRFGFSFGTNENDKIIITEITPGSPMWYNNGIKEGDEILACKFGQNQNILIDKLSFDEFVKVLQSATSDTMDITLLQNGQQNTYTVIKDLVSTNEDVIQTAVLKGEKNIGYIYLPDFYTTWDDEEVQLGCANDVAKAILKLKKENIEGLILDLRNNGGGSIKEALDLVGIFIDFGPITLVKNADEQIDLLKDMNRGAIYNAPLIVMINPYSASASEIVASALQDYKRALIVGQASFGKATGQGIQSIDPMAQLSNIEDPNWGHVKCTKFMLYRVTGGSHQKTGVIPDLLLPYTGYNKEFFSESKYPNALEVLPISKKVVYTPMLNLPIAILKQKSQERLAIDTATANYLNLQKSYFKDLKDIENKSFDLKSLEEMYAKIDQHIAHSKRINDYHFLTFTASSLSFDEELIQKNSFLKKYASDFKYEIEHDISLKETYLIMMDLIKNK